MKSRLCSLLLVLVMLFTLVACNSTPAASPTPDQSSTPPSTAPSDPVEPAAPTYPEKDITAMYFSAVGSGGDVMLRTMAKAVTPHLNGHNMVVENRVGSSGGVAMAHLVECAADGYTFMGTSTSIVLSSVFTDIPVKYDDFKYVCGMVKDPEYIYCRKDVPYNNIEELIAYAKENPDTVVFGYPMAQSSEALAQTVLIEESGISAKTVIFEGSTDCFTSLLGGHVDVSAGSYEDFQASYLNGDIKVLGTLLAEPTEVLPDVLPLKDQGVDIVLEKMRGIIVPMDTPDEVCDEIRRLVKIAIEDEEFRALLEGGGAEVVYIEGDDVKASYDQIAQYALEKLGA